MDSLDGLLIHAEKLGIRLLIENNVLAPFNFVDQVNPLLCCDLTDIQRLFKENKSHYLGLLFDTAHWKVSSNTLGFDPKKDLINLLPYLGCIHHSDNDGRKDTNEMINEEYWFGKFMSYTQDICHVLEVKNLSQSQIASQVQILNSYINV